MNKLRVKKPLEKPFKFKHLRLDGEEYFCSSKDPKPPLRHYLNSEDLCLKALALFWAL